MFGSSARESVLARPIPTRYKPQPDITAYELAQIFQNLSFGLGSTDGRVIFSPVQWGALSPEIKRHFEQL